MSVENKRRRIVWIAPLALTAAVVLAVVGMKLKGRSAITLLSPPVEIPAEYPMTFEWQAVPGATRYIIEVLDEKGAVVFTQTTDRTVAKIYFGSKLFYGASYHWWVRTSSGEASPMRDLRLRKP